MNAPTRQEAESAESTSGGLKDIRVIDFGQYLAGPLAAMLLADYGAEVIRVDPPGGPRWQHPANAILQRNKRSIILDLHEPADQAVARDLIDSADVVIEGFRPGVMARLGLRPDEMRRRNPRLVWCSIPGFGHDDPRAGLAGWEGIVCAAAGLYPPHMMAATGGPRFSALTYASNFAAFIAAHSIVAALISRERYGYGDEIEIPLFDASFEGFSVGVENPPSIDLGHVYSIAKDVGIQNAAERNFYKCRDGRMFWRDVPLRGKHNFWDRYMPPGLKDDTSPEGVERAARLYADLLLTKDAKEWERITQKELRASFGIIQTTEEWLHDDHALDSQSVVRVDDPILGPTIQAGFGVRVSGCDLSIRFSRREPGADGDAIRQELAALAKKGNARPDRAPTPSPSPDNQPLAGVRVLDFATLLAGPGACRVLAEYGAEVIKVNKAAVGLGKINLLSDELAMFVGHRTTAAGKKSMFLDQKVERGREIVGRLAAKADVINLGFAKGIAEDLGIGEADLRKIQPELIYSTVNVHGRGGWREAHRGHDQIAQAATGMVLRHSADGAAPEELGILVNDFTTAHISAFGLMVALLRKFRTGRGSTVESALSRTATLAQIPFMIDFEGQRWDEPRGPDAKGWGPLNRLYECADGWLYLAAVSAEESARLHAVEGFQSIGQLTGHALEELLETRFRSLPRSLWIERLTAARVPAHAYHDLASLLAEPIVSERRLALTKDHPGLEKGRVIGIAARFASMPNRSVTAAARPGWHTLEILEEHGYGKDEIAEMLKAEIVVGPMPAGSIVDLE